jgi:hypothetical protein
MLLCSGTEQERCDGVAKGICRRPGNKKKTVGAAEKDFGKGGRATDATEAAALVLVLVLVLVIMLGANAVSYTGTAVANGHAQCYHCRRITGVAANYPIVLGSRNKRVPGQWTYQDLSGKQEEL